MAIDWINPTDDVLAARRVGYEEGRAEVESQLSIGTEPTIEDVHQAHNESLGLFTDKGNLQWLIEEAIAAHDKQRAFLVTMLAEAKARGL